MAADRRYFWTNYHSHSHYCDGVEPPQAQVEGALRQGVAVFGFSSHCPLPFANAWSMDAGQLAKYLDETARLKAEYTGRMELYTGLEIDYLPGACGPGAFAASLDYTIGSVHYLDLDERGEPWEIDGSTDKFMSGLLGVHGGDIRRVMRLYYGRIREMIERDPPDVVGHLDKIKIHNLNGSLYDEEEGWYQDEIDETLALLAETDGILEVNTRGLYKKNLAPYPSLPILEKARALGIPVMLNSDSHAPDQVSAHFAETASHLNALGFRTLRVLSGGGWQDVAFDGNGLYL